MLLALSACSSDKDKVQTKPLATVQNPASLKMVWKGDTGNGDGKTAIDFAPALADGILYTVSQDGNLVAYDTQQGRAVWKQKSKVPLSSGATVGAGKLFVNDEEGELLVFNASNGAKLLTINLPNQSFAAPAYGHGIVVVKTVDEQMVAFNAEDGTQMWRYEGNAPSMILQGGSSPTIDNDIVVQGSADGQVTLVTLDKGQLLWQRPVVQPNGVSDIARMVDIDADPVVKGNTIYVASYQGSIVALDKFKATPIWQHALSTRNNLALTDDVLFSTDTKGRVWAFDINTGKVLWRQNKLFGRILTAAVISGDNIVIADNIGDVHWLSQADGHFVARVQLDKKGIVSSPVAEGNRVFVMSNKGAVVAYQL
ncbi:MAG: outer membrane protein assembly factor BamB [Gammaproteobacteria bacterium]|nr:outer membrane protein assembly factor BamB [Gammaproteobacteria bacterium]